MGLQVVRPRRNGSNVTQKTNVKIKTFEKSFDTQKSKSVEKNDETIVIEKRKRIEIEKSLEHCVKMTSVVRRRQLLGSCSVAQPPKVAAGLVPRGVKRGCSDEEIDSWFMGQDKKRAKFTGLNKKNPIHQDLGSQEVVRARVSGQRARVVTIDDIIKQQYNFLHHHQPTKGNHASATQPSRPTPVSTTAECSKEESRQRLRESFRLTLDEIENNSKPAFEDNRETMRVMHILMYGNCSHQQAVEYDALGIDYHF